MITEGLEIPVAAHRAERKRHAGVAQLSQRFQHAFIALPDQPHLPRLLFVDARIKPFAVRFVLRRTQKIHQRLFIRAVGLIECLHVGNGQRVLCADDPKRGERHDLGFVQRTVNVENRQIFDSHRGSPVKSFLPV